MLGPGFLTNSKSKWWGKEGAVLHLKRTVEFEE